MIMLYRIVIPAAAGKQLPVLGQSVLGIPGWSVWI